MQLFEQRIVALAVTRTHARFENRLRELHAPTEPRRLALQKRTFWIFLFDKILFTYKIGTIQESCDTFKAKSI